MITAEQVEKFFKLPKNIKEIMFRPLKHFYQFSGRSQRAEFFGYLLCIVVMTIIFFLITLINIFIPSPIVFFTLITLMVVYGVLLHLSLGVRRLHDINQSGWWIVISLIPYIGFILYLLLFIVEGTKGDNKFGKAIKNKKI